LLMPTKATLPYAGINVSESFSLAGFAVATLGRIWVATEGVGSDPMIAGL